MPQPKPEATKSDIIRDFVTKNPDVSIPEVVTMLGERGTEVSKALVYAVKSKMPTPKKKATTEPSDDVNKSEEIRQVLRANRKMKAKDVVMTLADKGITVTTNQVYFIKGEMKGRKKKAQKVVAEVAVATDATSGDAVKTILKVKGWATEVGGLKKLKALVDALSE